MASYTDRVWQDGRENGTAARWNAAAANDWEARIKSAFAAITTGGPGGGAAEQINQGTITANATLDMTTHQDVLWVVTLGASGLKLEIVGWTAGKSVTLELHQDPVGGRTLLQWPTALWEGGALPPQSLGPAAIDIRAFFRGRNVVFGFESGTDMQ